MLWKRRRSAVNAGSDRHPDRPGKNLGSNRQRLRPRGGRYRSTGSSRLNRGLRTSEREGWVVRSALAPPLWTHRDRTSLLGGSNCRATEQKSRFGQHCGQRDQEQVEWKALTCAGTGFVVAPSPLLGQCRSVLQEKTHPGFERTSVAPCTEKWTGVGKGTARSTKGRLPDDGKTQTLLCPSGR